MREECLHPLMFVGTGSDVGKSVIAAGFCRIFLQDGYHPAPFKAQNMSLNSYATPEGLEIGRAQAVQAEAAGIPCHTDMNPILLKPQSDHTSQVVLNGKPVGNQSAGSYFRNEGRDALRKEVHAAFDRLAARYNPIVMEGAGSVSEINLRKIDLVNMPMALYADADVILVADIDRGGVFASVYGSVMLMTAEERSHLKGVIINKFRGDIQLFRDGVRIIEDLCHIPVLGVVPYYTDIHIEEEDSVSLERKNRQAQVGMVNVAVVLLRHMSNFTDFDVLEQDPRVHLYYASNAADIQEADIVILPGSKSTVDDLCHLRRSGIAEAVIKARRRGATVLGICGGYQMMGREVCDPNHTEGDVERIPGLGLLPVTTTINGEKKTRQVTCEYGQGYEIHQGVTTPLGEPSPLLHLNDGTEDGYMVDDHCMGTYVHGILDNVSFIDYLLRPYADKLRSEESFDYHQYKEKQYDLLADHIRKHVDIPAVYRILGKVMVFLMLLMNPLYGIAQTDTITDRVHQLEEVTITETQRQHVVTSTAPLYLLDRKDMLSMGVMDIADALHRLPGITLRDYGGAGGMKTVSVRGLGAKHTGVSYDGVMLSDCQSGEIDLSRYSLDNVDNISLVIGDEEDIFLPARQITTPAVLDIQTLRLPTEDKNPHLTTQLKFGSFGYVSPFLRYEQNISNWFAFSAVAEYIYAENDYPYTIQNVTIKQHDRRTNSRMNSGHGELGFLWNINAVNRLTGKVYYYDNDRQLPGQVRYYTNVSKETLRDRNLFGQLAYQTRYDNLLSLKWQGKFNWYSSSYRDPLYQGGVNDADYWQREAYTAVALLFTPLDNWSFDYSADYAFNNLNGSSGRTVVGHPHRHTVLQSVTARYKNERLTVLGRLLYSLYLNDVARNMRRLSPSLSLSYQVMTDVDWYIRMSYKNIFRAPTFNENYYYHYGSLDLKPESTHQINVGTTFSNSCVNLTLDGYYNQVRDKIMAVPYNMFVWHCVNVGKVEIYGVDATVRVIRRLTEDQILSLSGSYSYQHAKDKTLEGSTSYGHQLAYTPQHTFSGSLGYENPWVNLSMHATGMSSRWANNEHYAETEIDGYMEVGLTAWRQFRFGSHQLEGRFDLKNLFNHQYELVRFYPMPGRSYQMTINYKF